ncbi:MAG: T9SS type A sorting domain-containing protein, partial [Fibrobacterales bacterium]
MELSISEALKNTILDEYRSSHNMRAVIPGGVFYTNDNVYYEPDSREIWFHLEQGDNFEIFSAWYQPIEGKVTIEFDGEIKMDSLYAMSGTLRVGTSNTNNVIIPFANPSTEHAHLCGTEPNSYEQECTTTIDIYISPEQKKSITELGDQNNLLIAMNDGAFYSRNSNPLVNAQFENKIRIYFGTDGGENWVQSATISPNDGRIVLNMDREISSLYDITLDESNSSGTQLFMVMVVDVKGVDNQYSNNSEGGDLPPESDPRVLYISKAQNGVQLLGNQIIITLNQENRTKVQNWRGDYRYALDYGDIGFMVGPETMTSTAGEVGGGFENSIEVLPFDDVEGSGVEGSSVPAPQVKVVTNEGLSYFECTGDTTWIVTVYPNAIRNDCIVGQRVYLEKGATYRVVAQDSEGTPSDAVTQSSVGRPTPDVRIDTTGTALLIGFISENVDDIDNATFSYSIRVGDSVVVSDTAYTSWGYQFFGDNGQTYIVEAKMESLEKGEPGFINQFSITDTMTLVAPSMLLVKANEWNMLSFGGVPFEVAQLTDSETLFKWDDNKIEDLLFSKYLSKDALDYIEPAQACWYLSEIDREIELKYSTEIVSTALSNGDEGWNQVANPYSFNIVTKAFGGDMEFFKWNGSQYYKVNYLKPGEGYLTYVASDQIITINKDVAWETEELYSLQTYKKSVANEQDWELMITLVSEDGSLQDQYNVIGVKPMASNGIDVLDKYELPSTMDDAVVFSVLEGDKVLRTNYKEPIEELGLWKVSVGTTSKRTSSGTLSFEGIDDVRSLGYSVYLTDGRVQTEVVGATIPVSLNQNKEYGIIVAKSGVIAHTQGGSAGVFNYPNPVRGYTKISLRGIYSLGDEATLKVIDVSGSVVYTAVYNTDSEIIWNAESNNGSPVETGMYYYELQTGGSSYSNVMMITQ